MTHPLAITTNRAEASKVILAAIEAGTLTAPHGLQGTYAHPGPNGLLCHCGVGVLYPSAVAYTLEHILDDGEDEDVEALRKDLRDAIGSRDYPMAAELMKAGLLIVPDEDREWFIRMQTLQDQWAAAVDEIGGSDATDARETFMAHLS